MKRNQIAFLMLMLGAWALVAPEGNAASPLVVKPEGMGSQQVFFWVASSLERIYPTSEAGTVTDLTLLAPRNGQVSFQACLRNDGDLPLGVECSVAGGEDLDIQVRRVGYVPVKRHTPSTPPSEFDDPDRIPGYVPDVLYPQPVVDVGPYENASFWMTVKVPAKVKPGPRQLKVTCRLRGRQERVELPVTVQVSEFVVQPRRDFPVTHWWRAAPLWAYYNTGMYEDERLWEILRNYIQNLIDHGTDVIYVPVFWLKREPFSRASQLLIVDEPEPGRYEFDFSRVKRFIDMARECGAKEFEWTHLWIYWGVENPIRVFKVVDGKREWLWPLETDGHGEMYHNFLRQYLGELHQFLVKEDLLDKSYFHLSDEPGGGQHIENYKKARAFLRETAPWMKVMDALSEIEYGKQGLTDMPIPMVSAAQAYIDAGIPHWVYYCCYPRGTYLNRFLDTPLPKIRMGGFLFYRLKAKGFLHWGYNHYMSMGWEERYVDPFTELDCADISLPPGDGIVVYPGPDGKPLDSIRWEVFAESLQDYAILQTAGIDPDDPMLADIKGYGDFPKNEEWINRTLEKVLAQKTK